MASRAYPSRQPGSPKRTCLTPSFTLNHQASAALRGNCRSTPLLVGRRALHDLEFRMGREHLVVHPADPVAARTDFAVRHREQVLAERRTKSLEDLFRRVDWNTAHQQKLTRHKFLH